jgi:Zn-dependent protease with chaperone function
MAPLQVILLLLLVRVPGIAGSPLSGEALLGGGWFGRRLPAATVFGAFLFLHLLLVIAVAIRGRAAMRLMHQPSSSATLIMGRMDRVVSWARWATLAVTAVHVYALGVPALLQEGLSHTQILRHLPLLPEATMLAPAILSWICFWASYYGVEAAQRHRQLPYRLGQGLPAHEMPPLGRYLSMQVRHNYYLLLPLGAAGMLEEVGKLLTPYWPWAGWVIGPLSLGVLFLLVPWLITRVWLTTPLRGPLRTKLDAMARQHGLRFRNILVWKTHNAVTNAAILGFLPFSRYFLMTDALLETLTDRQIEAVFAHEVGHGVHRHIWWYLASMVAVFLVAAGVLGLTAYALAARFPWTAEDAVQSLAAIVMAGGFLLFLFPKIAHRFEHQADWFAAKHMAGEIAAHPASEAVIGAALTQEVPADGAEDVVPFFPPEPLTLDQYLAGNFARGTEGRGADAKAEANSEAPGEPAAVAAAVGESGVAPPAEKPAAIRTEPAVLGAEVFVSALDTIIEVAHKSRNKAGWMHPSVNGRIALIRDLAVNRPAAARFDSELWWTRAVIAGVLAAGIVMQVIVLRLPAVAAGRAAPGATGTPAVGGAGAAGAAQRAGL